MAINYDEDRTESTQDSLIVIAQLSSMLVSDVRQENIQALAALQQLVSCTDQRNNLQKILTPLKSLGRISFASQDDCTITRMLYELMDFIVRDYKVLSQVKTLSRLALKVVRDGKDPLMRKAAFQWFGGVIATDEGISIVGERICVDILEGILAFAIDNTGPLYEQSTAMDGLPQYFATTFPTPENSEDEQFGDGKTMDVDNNPSQEEMMEADSQKKEIEMKLSEKLQSFVTLLECFESMSSSMLVPYYEDTIRAFSNGFKANAWELRRLGINGLTKITEFSEEMTFMDIHYEPTTKAIVRAVNSVVLGLTSKPQQKEDAHVVVAGLDFVKIALILYGRDIFTTFPLAKLKIQDLLLGAFVRDLGPSFNYGRIEMEDSLVLGALNCIRHFGEFIPQLEFLDFFKKMFKPLMNMWQTSVIDMRRTVGIIAESAEVLKETIFPSINHYIRDIFQVGISHGEPEVRSDTVHAFGEVLAHGKRKIKPLVPFLLDCFKEMARYEREPEVIDDIVTALAKFLLHNFNSIRQEVVVDILELMMDCIPLKVRVMDNEVLFDCFRSLFNHSRKLIIPFVPRIIDNITVVLSTKESFDHGGNCEKAKTIFKSAASLERYIRMNCAAFLPNNDSSIYELN